MPNWTNAQQDAINANGGTILVSAAAGSGKTAVLVQRVIELITKSENNVDIDSMLIVTFTNAAAAEMKSRISDALKKIIRANNKNENAKKQLSLLSGANICTIDAFCLKLVKEYFFNLDISSDFRLMDENENTLLIDDAINKVLDRFYEDANKDFMLLANTFTLPDSDKDFFSVLKELYRFIFAQPFPIKWLKDVTEFYNPNTDFDNTKWFQYAKSQILLLTSNALKLVDNCLDIINDDIDNAKLKDVVISDKSNIEHFKESFNKGWDNSFDALSSINFVRMTTSKKVDPELKAVVNNNRKIYKEIIQKAIAPFYVCDSSDYKEDAKLLYRLFSSLLSVITHLDKEVMNLKADKNAYSFADIEHFAISLLYKVDENGEFLQTDLATQLQNSFSQILVDEYQDTNEAQDKLFEFLSGSKNCFMVGDVKQSIYRFRLAMPKLFTKKKNAFIKYDDKSPTFPAKIILDKNFRSRKGICEYVNHIFSLLMTNEVGELDYNKDEYLNYGADYKDTDIPSAQINIIDGVSGEDTDRIEAASIAKLIINKVKNKEQITDKNGTIRNVQFGDFAILMRSLRAHINDYSKIFEEYHIPVVCDNSKNLFENSEIQLVLSLLQVIDNPMQDIPLLAVLMSPIYGFTPDELSEIRIEFNKKGSLYSNIFNSVMPKAQSFVSDINQLRKESVVMSVSEFIRKTVREKSVLAFVSAMSDSEQRQANIELFIHLAENFDKTGSVGITSFMHYIEKIISSDSKTDSAPVISTNSNAVKIMSVHHSKGLEFPICILAGAGRKYNIKDASKKLLIDSELGISAKCHDENLFLQYPSLPYAVLKDKISKSMQSENLRVLYVAMTRAKEQFITFATLKNATSRISAAASYMLCGKPVPYCCSKCYDDIGFLLMAAVCHKDGKNLRDIAGLDVPVIFSDFNMSVNILNADDNFETESSQIIDLSDDLIISQIDEKLKFNYKYSNLSSISAKRSASSLDNNEKDLSFLTSSVPAFMNKEGLTPAQRGTAMHTFMQFCDYEKAKANLDDELFRIHNMGYLTEEELKAVDKTKLREFFYSDFAKRIFESNKIYREIKISSYVLVSDVEQIDCDDKILVQGIADCVFEEDNGVVIVDYKTDRLNSSEELLNRYHSQLQFYKTAIEKTLQKPVKEVYLYSFSMSKPCRYNFI